MSERACGVRLHPAARLLRWMGRHAVGVCFLLIGVWLFRAVLAGADGISYDWQWYRVWRYLGRWTDGHFIPGPLLDGLGMTVRIALFGLALAVAAGLGAALLRLSPWPVARGMAHVYVGCLRNTPLLLQLFFVYFLFAPAIAVADLTMQAQVLIADTFLAFEIWLIVAALYLALTLCVALPARWMERRYAWR